MKNKTLFIGCGGSGIKTLQRVNELLAGNPETRQIMRENISYMIFDLDVSETENFKENIRKQVGNAGMPFIKAVQVTRNLTNLEELVHPTFDEFKKQTEDDSLPLEVREEARKKLRRLKQNWWYSPDFNPDDPKGEEVESIPFRAQNITEGLNQGAGQCGPVSFLATWNYLPNLKRDLLEIVEAIQIRNTDAQGVGLNVVVVAGTAGGTGRGCWQPIAFKVSQTLREMGFVNNPIGVFFDSTCFKNVMEASPNERLNLSVNSLTAMSELSAWMMQPVIRTFQFALPNLKNPGTELIVPGSEPPENLKPEEKKEWYARKKLIPYTASTDVISVPPDGDNELSPITTAYLIFGNNGIAALKNNNQYHEMAAAALYAMVAQDEFIGPGAVNRHESVRSFGALTFEVQTIPIRRFMEAMVRGEYSKTLYQPAEPRPADKKDEKPERESAYILDDEAKQLVIGLGGDEEETDAKKQPFFVKTKFCVDQEVKTVGVIQPTYKKASLLQQLIAQYAEENWGWQPDGNKEEGPAFPTATEPLIEALNSQDPDEVKSKVEELLTLESISAESIEEALTKNESLAVLKIDRENLAKIIQETVMGAFAPEGVISVKTNRRMEPSVGRAVAVVKQMKARIVQSIANLGLQQDNQFGVQIAGSVTVRNSDECASKFIQQVVEPNEKKRFWELKRFSKGKIDVITQEFQNYLVCAVYFKLRKVLKEKFNSALEALDKVEESLSSLIEGLQKVGKYFDNEICKACDVKNGDLDKAYRELFVDDDEEAIFRSLPKMDATTNVFKRTLKPIMSRETVKQLIRANTEKNEKPIRESLAKFVRELIKGEAYPTPEDAQDAIRSEFADLITMNVSLKFEKNTDFMTREFNFVKVLKSNLEYWNKLLSARAGSEDILGELKDRLRKYLGIAELDREDGKFRIKWDSLLEGIVTSMAGDCKPWMELKESAHETYLNTIALIPTDESNVDVEVLCERVKEKFPGKVLHAYLKDGKHGDLIPKDRIIVYTAMAVTVKDAENPFDSIQSLDYYQEADYSRLLVRAEDDVSLLSYFYPIKDNPAARVKWGEQRDTHGFVSPIFIKEQGLASTRWRPWKKYDNGINAEKQLALETDSAVLFGLLGSGDVPDELKEIFKKAGWKCEPLFVKGDTLDELKVSRKCDAPKAGKNAWAPNQKFTTIKQLRETLSGKGRESQQGKGSALEADQEKGTRMRLAILEELEIFRTKIAPAVGGHALEELLTVLKDWLDKRDEVPNTSHKDMWKDLYEFANAGKFVLTRES